MIAPSSVTPDSLLDRLVDLSRRIESHRAALYLLETERLELQAALRQSGWTSPPIGEASP